MAEDLRIALDFADHPKTVHLVRELGDVAVRCLLRLWGFAGRYRPKGRLNGMSASDIAVAARWPEEDSERFLTALVRIGFIDKHKNGLYVLHGWHEHQRYIVFSPERRAVARKNAKQRWAKKDNELAYAEKHKRHKNFYAPSPTPIPSPNPSPDVCIDALTRTNQKRERTLADVLAEREQKRVDKV